MKSRPHKVFSTSYIYIYQTLLFKLNHDLLIFLPNFNIFPGHQIKTYDTLMNNSFQER